MSSHVAPPKAFKKTASTALPPLYAGLISAGFPTMNDDTIEQRLDLNHYCIQHPAATFFMRVEGESMLEAGIFPADVLVVDKALEARHGDIVIAQWQGAFTVKELALQPKPMLLSRNNHHSPIVPMEEEEWSIFGVVIGVVRKLRRL